MDVDWRWMAGKKIGIHHGRLTGNPNIIQLKEKIVENDLLNFHVWVPC